MNKRVEREMNTPQRNIPHNGNSNSELIFLLITLVILLVITLIVLGVIYYKKDKTIVYITQTNPNTLNHSSLTHNPTEIEPSTTRKSSVEEIKEAIIQNEKITDLKLLDQKILINLIHEYGGSILQKDLVKASKFSKAKISRLLKELEAQKVIERKPIGQTFLIILK